MLKPGLRRLRQIGLPYGRAGAVLAGFMSDQTEQQPASVPWYVAYRAAKAAGTYRKYERSVVPSSYGRVEHQAVVRGLEWLLPWNINDYPGYRKGALEVLGKRVAWGAVIMWRKRKRCPVWALRLVYAAVSARVESGQAILAELSVELAEAEKREASRRNVGFCEVRDDGRDRRGNWRK